ncbi:MAG: sigma-70 family RNA polymerase sigma factor [Chloroflexi bacterium]|nr:sigma-70 family RNA polymerase sigma factor [Chloroflexota bacterium]
MTDLHEQALLRGAQAGDYEAFEQLHAALEGPLRRFVQRLIGDTLAVDDVVQMTFIALYRNLERIDPVETLRPYVFRIARNRCYDELRRQGRFDTLSMDDEPVEVRVSFTAGQQVEAEDTAHWLLLHLEVQEAMNRLPELQRETLILYAEEELSYSEIALVMETNIGTVKSRLFQARKMLRRLLRPQTLQALDIALVKENNTDS